MSEWTDTTLGELCETSGGNIQTGPFGSQLHAYDYVASGVPSVMPKDIGENVVIADGIARVREEDVQRLSKHQLRKGDIVYSRRGDVEKRAYIRAENDGWLCGTGCLRIRFGDEADVDARFIAYLLGTSEARAWITRHAVGATMPNLNSAILRAVPVRVPEPITQRAIARVLCALDDKIAQNRRSAAVAHELAGALYEDATREQPRVPLTSALTPILGGTPARSNHEYWGGDVPWVSAKDVAGAQDGVILSTAESITELATESTRARRIPRGSVIVTARGTVGAVARLGVAAAFNQSCYAFVPGALPPSLLYWSILSVVSAARSFAHGSVFDTITTKTFDHLSIPSLPVAAISEVEDKLSWLLELVEQAQRERRQLEMLRDALLPKLMSGELRVKDAEKTVEEVL